MSADLNPGPHHRHPWHPGPCALGALALVFGWLPLLAAAQALVQPGAPWKHLPGVRAASSPDDAWRQAGFDDSAWRVGPTPLRFGDGEDGTVLGDMQNRYATVFLRHAFVVRNAAQEADLRVAVDYDDGFILWLNGREILRVNAPERPTHQSLATANHESGAFETFLLPGAGIHLRPETNVLAAQAFNVTLNSSDFLFDLRLEAARPEPVLPRAKPPRFSLPHGFYATNLTVTLTSDEAGTEIAYTLDGSDPRASATARKGPAPLTVPVDPASTYDGRRPRVTPAVTLRATVTATGQSASRVATQTYLFAARVRAQGKIVPSGQQVFWDTTMDAKVVNDPRYRPHLEQALQDIPTLSIVMDWEDLFGPLGIHRGNHLNNSSLEKPCSMELLYPPGSKFAGHTGFQVNAGLKIQGGGGRWHEGRSDPKQSFTLLFQPAFDGPGRLKQPLFAAAPVNADKDVGEYNRLILRAGHNKSWAGPGPNPRQTTVYTRDEYARASQLALSGRGGGALGTFVHLYLNGLYWGLYNPVERPDHHFLAIHFGGDGEWYDSYKERSGDPNGNRQRLDATPRALANPKTPYATVKEYVDTAQFIDYLLVTWATGVSDGPQWYAGNARRPAGPIRWFCWDYEDSFTPAGQGRGAPGYAWNENNPLWTALRQHPEFKLEVADRLQRHCFHDGEFTDAKNVERWLSLADFVENAIIGESARWGGVAKPAGYTPPLNRDDHWYPARDQVTAMLRGNTARMVRDLRARGYFPGTNVNAPRLLDTGGRELGVSQLVFSNSVSVRMARDGSTGAIYWTANGPDPRAEGGAVQGTDAGQGTNLIFTATTTLRVRVRHNDQWSPVRVVTFHAAGTRFDALKLTEIMYHPAPVVVATQLAVTLIRGDAGGPDAGRALVRLAAAAETFGTGDTVLLSGGNFARNQGRFTVKRIAGRDIFLDQTLTEDASGSARASLYLDGDRYEFLELQNTGPTPLNLTGVRFTAGIDYEFPAGAMLDAGEFWVLTPHWSKFAERHPKVTVRGRYQGQLDNAGERVTLADFAGNRITTVNYGDRAPWPETADGGGCSLVPRAPNPAGPQGEPSQWRASPQPGGSPGAQDP